jgi:3-methyl-2-oxobutanoate hydroxymethyltransferase
VECGIPVMGHIGLTPQSVYQLGGLKVQAKSLETATRLIEDAQALEQAGAFSIVLEAVPYKLASKQYAKLTDIIRKAVTEYDNEVKAGTFPTEKHSFIIDESVLAKLKAK